MKLRLNETPEQRIRRIWHEDHAGFAIQTRQDVEPIMELTKEEQKDSDGKRYNDFLTLVARIPTSIYYSIIRGAKTEEERDERIKRWLNDPDNRVFRSKAGIV